MSNIYDDIKRASQLIPSANYENVKFVQREDYKEEEGHNQYKRKPKPRRYKPPKNANLLENDGDADLKYTNFEPLTSVPREEIAAAIKEATGGVDYTNEHFEQLIKRRQQEAALREREAGPSTKPPVIRIVYDSDSSNESITPTPTPAGTQTPDIKPEEKPEPEDEESILRKCKLNKNAAIRGLLKNKLISIADLQLPKSSKDVVDESNVSAQKTNVIPPSSLSKGNHMKLVPSLEDPDVLVQPLQAEGGIDETKYKDIDFTVPRIGKKTSVTPRRFYLDMDDDDFYFIKREKKKKNNGKPMKR